MNLPGGRTYRLFVSERWWLVVVLAALYIFSYVDRLILALLIEPLKADLQLTDTQIALLLGPAFAILYSAAGLPIAWLVDRGNRIMICSIGVLTWSLCTVGAAFANSFELLMAFRMGVAIGEAVLSPAAVSLIADHFRTEERGTPTAMFVAAGALGSMLAYGGGGALIDILQRGYLDAVPVIGTLNIWRATLVIVGLPGVFLTAALLLSTREPKRSAVDMSHDSSTKVGAFSSMRDAVRFYVSFFVGNSIVSMIILAAMVWYPTYLVRRYEIGLAESGYRFSFAAGLSAIVLLAITMIAGRLARRGRTGALVGIELIVLPIGALMLALSLMQDSIDMLTFLLIGGVSIMSGLGGLASIAVGLTAPAAFRGRLIAINLACVHVIGLGGGPMLVALMADHLFTGPLALGHGLLTLTLVGAPIAWLLVFLAWKPLRSTTLQ